jgi:hypothetical protein
VCCVDLSTNKGLAAYAETFTAAGPVEQSAADFNARGVRSDLVKMIAHRLRSGPVALGIEGPLWGLTLGPVGPYVRRPFELIGKSDYSWCGGAGNIGAATTLKAQLILAALMRDLVDALDDGPQLEVCFAGGGTEFNWRAGSFLLWKAFVGGHYKEVPVCLPETCRFRTNPDVLDAARAVWAGFSNHPERLTTPSELLEQVVPLAVNALLAAGVSLPPELRPGLCAVVAPGMPRGVLLWP